MRLLAIHILLGFSLLAAPVIHAMDLDCADGKCSIVKEESSKDGKMAKVDHACCCHHNVTDRHPIHVSQASTDGIAVSFSSNTANPVSALVGPLLEPPSHV